MRQLLFSITKKDFEIQTFRCPGKGGQNVNKVESGVRLIHRESGAVGHSCTHRHQHQNKVEAFQRLVETKEFKAWHRIECARRMGVRLPETEEQIRERVDRMVDEGLKDGSILIEELPDGMMVRFS
jgi:protein subunit release factor B